MNPEQITAELRDIKPAIEIPEAAAGLSPYAVAALITAAVAIIAWAIWWWRHRTRQTPPADPVAEALRELDTAREILVDADSEAYAIAVSNVLRRYLQRHLSIGAARQTTDEFLAALASDQHGPLHQHRDSLRTFLDRCDLVKFARGQLDQPEREQLHSSARDFIETTARTHDRDTGETDPQPSRPTASAVA